VYPVRIHGGGGGLRVGSRQSPTDGPTFLPSQSDFTGMPPERIELDYFKPITNRYNVSVDKGFLSATVIRIRLAGTECRASRGYLDGIKVDYITRRRRGREQAASPGASKAAKARAMPGSLVKIARLRITRARLAMSTR